MKVKYKILMFLEKNGIAKKILNHLEKKGTVEISLVGLRGIIILGIVSVLINCYFIIQSGVIQQGIISLTGFIYKIIKDFLYILKDFDEHSPGTLSFIGAIIGGGLGFYGATTVFNKQLKLNNKKSINKLMHLILYTYRMISDFLEASETYEEFRKNLKESNLYNQLVYDKNWMNYISEIKDYEDAENILRWLFNIENRIVPDEDAMELYFLSIENILKKYGFKYQLNIIKMESRIRLEKHKEQVENSNTGLA